MRRQALDTTDINIISRCRPTAAGRSRHRQDLGISEASVRINGGGRLLRTKSSRSSP